MARAKKASGPKTAPTEPQLLTLRPTLVLTDDTPTYYVNHAEFAGGTYDISMIVARLPSRPTPEQIEAAKVSQAIHVEAELQLVFPPSLLPALIRALTSQKEAYEKNIHPIFDPEAPQ
jgi:hypothetical protein